MLMVFSHIVDGSLGNFPEEIHFSKSKSAYLLNFFLSGDVAFYEVAIKAKHYQTCKTLNVYSIQLIIRRQSHT